MTDEQKWDRLERIVRLLAQPDPRRRRGSREQLMKLRALAEKHKRDDERLANEMKAIMERLKHRGTDDLDFNS